LYLAIGGIESNEEDPCCFRDCISKVDAQILVESWSVDIEVGIRKNCRTQILNLLHDRLLKTPGNPMRTIADMAKKRERYKYFAQKSVFHPS
jgi:hypothetical protein